MIAKLIADKPALVAECLLRLYACQRPDSATRYVSETAP